jgi:hypothetical protein
LTLLYDLLLELPVILSQSEAYKSEDESPDNLSSELIALQATLRAWLDYLSATPDQREHLLKRLDPDIASTIIGLCENLSPKARHRFGIIPLIAKA